MDPVPHIVPAVEPLPAKESTPASDPSDYTDLLLCATHRLFLALLVMMLGASGVAVLAHYYESQAVMPPLVMLVGIVGGFIGLQRRLKHLTPSDLNLIATSWCSISLKGPTRFQGRGPLKSAERSDEAICTVYINPH
jgi:hypothetical protein